MPTPTTSISYFANTINKKLASSIPISFEDCVSILSCTDPLDRDFFIQLANNIRKKKAGDTVPLRSILYLYPTNLCIYSCPFCAFYAKPNQSKAYINSPQDLANKIIPHLDHLTEVHIVGGMWNSCNLDYYKTLFSLIKSLNPKIHIKALTVYEHEYLASLHKMPIEDVFSSMIEYGLNSIPGGGAEIFNPNIRKRIAPQKSSGQHYLDLHGIAHKLNIPSTVTMLFGHIEQHQHIAEHLLMIREQQKKTKGFTCFIPLKYQTKNNSLSKYTSNNQNIDLELYYAAFRITLYNIENIKILWNYIGIDIALKLLNSGGNDLSGTNTEESVCKSAGGHTVTETLESLSLQIKQINRIPLLI